MNKPVPQPVASAETGHPPAPPPSIEDNAADVVNVEPVREIGGRKDGTEPTRFGDWEKGGRCIDF